MRIKTKIAFIFFAVLVLSCAIPITTLNTKKDCAGEIPYTLPKGKIGQKLVTRKLEKAGCIKPKIKGDTIYLYSNQIECVKWSKRDSKKLKEVEND